MSGRPLRTFALVLAFASTSICLPASGAPVEPDFSAAEFGNPLDVTNPYFPLVPGTVRQYSATLTDPDTGETELLELEDFVTFQTETIAGVASRVVRAREFVDGVVVEDTIDWYAQDDDGNVWYMGEDTKELDEDGNVVSTQGSWRALGNGARPGHIMPADPLSKVGLNYFQENAPAQGAIDDATILGRRDGVSVPAGTFDDVLLTRETSALEPDARENKLYAPGVGLVLIQEDLDDAGEPQTSIPLQSVAVVPLPPAAWAAVVTGAVVAVPCGLRAARRRLKA
jgi:hypothetical protein